MAQFLEKIHRKPEAYRKNLALGITVASMAIIFSFWALTFSARYMTVSPGGTASVADSSPGFFSPFQQISDGMSRAYEGMKSSLSNIGESF